nr:SMR family transporter [Rickettsia bellii]
MFRWFDKTKTYSCLYFFGALSFTCLAKTLGKIPMGTAYAVWTGIGAAGGTVILGILVFNEPVSIYITLIFCYYLNSIYNRT